MALKDANKEQIQLADELKDIGKGKISVEKATFLKKAALLIIAREKFLITLKAKYSQQKTQIKFQQLNQPLNQQYLIFIHDETNVSIELFNEYFKYPNPTFLLKDLYEPNKTRSNKIVNRGSDAFIDLRNAVNRKEIPEYEKPEGVIDIAEEILNFNK